jgi:hypothetical protein
MAAGVIWHIAMNPHRLPCGCATWQQWDQRQGAWTPRAFRCQPHQGGG